MAVEASEVLTSAADSRPEQFCTASYGKQLISAVGDAPSDRDYHFLLTSSRSPP